jgi:ribulose-5-phosphate 4-epimerase/fuculose-1-phosphate aldolase
MKEVLKPEVLALIEDLVNANHILYHQQVVDAFGHVSVRHPFRADRFLMARNLAPIQVESDDILEFDLDGTAVNAQGRRLYLERFIHGSIYRQRPDVNAVVHSHSPSVVPFTISRSSKLRPVCHMSGFLGAGVPLFEIRKFSGNASDLLVSNDELGRALANTLGTSDAVLMRGHGSTVVAPSLKLAVYRAVYAEVNAKIQSQAQALGDIEYLTNEEAKACMVNTEGQVERPWEFWKAAARKSNSESAAT